MTIYFCINDILDQAEKNTSSEQNLNQMVFIETVPPKCNGFPGDAFTLSSTPHILNIDNEDAAAKLSVLIDDTPLYHINIELAVDDALAERHQNIKIMSAIKDSFKGEQLPNTLLAAEEKSNQNAGSLKHPMLGHIDNIRLCEIYINFIRSLEPNHRDYNFYKNIIGNQQKPFLEHFDGFVHGNTGMTKLEHLIAFGIRQDHCPQQQLEYYVEDGKKKAQEMAITDAKELCWAWLEADHYQMRRCHDIHRIKIIEDLPRAPNWVRTDIFSLLSKEAMKQHFAESLKEIDPDFTTLDTIPLIKKAISDNAEGNIDNSLQQLLSQTLNVDSSYSGAAEKFCNIAEKRNKEAQKVQLL